jgi:hypothetical protein
MAREAAVRAFLLAVALVAGVLLASVLASTNPLDMGPFWKRPASIASQDLFNGPWGADHAPDPEAMYTFVDFKTGGINPGMTVRDPQGRVWKVKQPPNTGRAAEGPIEVVLSRVLSGVGYHQPPVYYLESFALQRNGSTGREPGGRFRLKDASLDDIGEWAWRANPYVGTRPHHGLLVILLLLNSSDLKDSNNTLYAVKPPASSTETLWYVVRDLGTALGSTGRLAPKRGDIKEFERRGFIKHIDNGFVEFHYDGRHQDLVDHRIQPEDVIWATELLAELTPAQWDDAFRAGGFAPDLRERFIRRIQQKIAEGLALRGQTIG